VQRKVEPARAPHARDLEFEIPPLRSLGHLRHFGDRPGIEITGGRAVAAYPADDPVAIRMTAELTVEVARTVIVDRHLGVDTIALVAMLGALALEAVASRRARRELTRLVERAPHVARLHVDNSLEEVPERRLTGPRRPQHDHELLCVHVERHVSERDDLTLADAITPRHVLEMDQRGADRRRARHHRWLKLVHTHDQT
jgi:hypothetical protein